MGYVFPVKLRKVGSSVGLIVPKEHLDELGVGAGDEVDVSLLKHRNWDEIMREVEHSFGIAKHVRTPFVRDKKVREF